MMLIKQYNLAFVSLCLIFCLVLSELGWHPIVASTIKNPSAQQLANTPLAVADRITAPKWLATPQVDGQCDDPAYIQAGSVALVTNAGPSSSRVQILHSALDFYLCFSGLPGTAGQRVVARVDSDHSRSTDLTFGDYEFSVTAAGSLAVMQGSAAGVFAPLTIPEGDFAAVALPNADPRDLSWNAEVRINLEWLGGYARVDGLSLALEQADGTTLAQWPAMASASSPASWGDLELAPLYANNLEAGSLFLDGRESFVVVPYTPELNLQGITLEAWVRTVDGDCGTLIGNGQKSSFWLGLCRQLQFGHDSIISVHVGQRRLGEGWHHVAVTMSPVTGIRSYYVDGELDGRPGAEPIEEERGEEEPIAYLGFSDRMLRIGSDRDAPASLDHLHGYVRELRIWSRERSADEIRTTAFQSLSGREPGLVALWPFTHGLQDLASGHHAGLVGNAGLAHQTLDVRSFPEPSTPTPYIYPDPAPAPAWNALIPFWQISPTQASEVAGLIDTQAAPTLDGICRPEEYDNATELPLEPDHHAALQILLTPTDLYLCTNILFGQPGDGSALTFWINRNHLGGATPGAADLRLRLTPDGVLTVGTGDGQDFTGPAPTGVISKTVSGTKLDLQEDIRPISAPWWSGEIRIPLEALTPFRVGLPLRMALLAEGMIPGGIHPDLPEVLRVSNHWPADFSPQSPDSWGLVISESWQLYLPLISSDETAVARAQPVAEPTATGAETPQHDRPANPPSAPSEANFYSNCPADWWLSPAHAAWYASYMTDSQSKWPRVDASNHPLAQAEGVFYKIGISKEDSPFIHTTHDLDMNLNVDAPFTWVKLAGETDPLVMETESGAFDLRAMPSINDHVTVKGRWIFDCGHGPKTEIHPIYYWESDRLELRPTGLAPGDFQEVRVARIWLNSNPGKTLSHGLSEPFKFDLELPDPSGATLPFLRVVHGPLSAVELTALDNNSTAHITITPPASQGAFYFELLLGYLADYNTSSRATYTVSFDKIVILDDLDHGLPDCGSVFDPGDCGEWTLWASVNGVWNKFFSNKTVDEDNPIWGLGINVPVIQDNLVLHLIGYENDDILIGDSLNRDKADLGPLDKLCCDTQHIFDGGAYHLYYTVHANGAPPKVYPAQDATFWSDRLVEEPNNSYPRDLGTIPVPLQGAPALVTSHAAFLTEWPLQRNGVFVMADDVDKYTFTVGDFANVAFSGLPAGLNVDQKCTDKWYFSGLPPNLQQLLGCRTYTLAVDRTSGQNGDQPYTLQINTTSRVLPPDWGEDDDRAGRLVDLFTPVAATSVYTQNVYDGIGGPVEHRELQMEWAWQHVVGDLDYYTVHLPPGLVHPPGQLVTECDHEPQLEVEAQGMRLNIKQGSSDIAADNSFFIQDVRSQYPDGFVRVEIENLTNPRGFYRFRAHWIDAAYVTQQECNLIKVMKKVMETYAGFAAIDLKAVLFPKLFLANPPPERIELPVYQLGGYTLVHMRQGGTFDAIISGRPEQPLIARLYDINGILLGESILVGDTDIGATRIPDGVLPQSRLTVAGVVADGIYLLQVVPVFAVGPNGTVETPLGISQAMSEP